MSTRNLAFVCKIFDSCQKVNEFWKSYLAKDDLYAQRFLFVETLCRIIDFSALRPSLEARLSAVPFFFLECAALFSSSSSSVLDQRTRGRKKELPINLTRQKDFDIRETLRLKIVISKVRFSKSWHALNRERHCAQINSVLNAELFFSSGLGLTVFTVFLYCLAEWFF